MKKNNLSRLNSTSGGALLFAIITAFVVSFITAGLVMLTANQYRTINSEIDRKKAYYKIRAGVEYANYYLYIGGVVPPTTPLTCPDYPELNISISEDTRVPPISKYRINVTTGY